MTQQWIRDYKLTVGSGSNNLDLSALRIRFDIKQRTTQAPNAAVIRVNNLSDKTANSLAKKEFTTVTLSAGYTGSSAVIFSGDIKQANVGRESATDTYVDLFAADGDQGYNYGVVNKTLAAGCTQQDIFNACAQSMQKYGVTAGYAPNTLTSFKYPRAVTMFGMARDYLRTLAQSSNCTWSIQNGKLQMVPLNGAVPGSAVVLNSTTGLIGRATQTAAGIYARCLINPSIKVNQTIQIQQKSVNPAAYDLSYNQGVLQQGNLPSIAADGLYRVLVVDVTGDSRGQPWYFDLVCASLSGLPGIGSAALTHPDAVLPNNVATQ
jgi:hypothetical protein